MRNFSLELSQDLVLLDIRKSTFQHLTVDCNFNVLEMALKTIRFVQGLARTPLLYFLRYFKTGLRQIYFFKIDYLEILKSPKSGNPFSQVH